MTAPRCPRCAGEARDPQPVQPPGSNPWAYGPTDRLPLCTHPFHQDKESQP